MSKDPISEQVQIERDRNRAIIAVLVPIRTGKVHARSDSSLAGHTLCGRYLYTKHTSWAEPAYVNETRTRLEFLRDIDACRSCMRQL